MRNVAVLMLGLVCVAGCGTGTNVASGVSLAQARTTCVTWGGTAFGGTNFNSLVLVLEAARDNGARETDALSTIMPKCTDVSEPDPSGCVACITQLAAAIWN